MRKLVVVALVLGTVLAGNALAREKKERAEAKEGTGTFVSATIKPEGGAVTWKLALDGEGEKAFDMTQPVVVTYSEKNNQKHARMIRPVGKKVPEAKGKTLVAQGQVTKAETQGKRVIVTVKVGDGADAAEQEFTLTSRLTVRYRDGEPPAALSIASAGRGEKGAGKKKDDGGVKPPENL